MSGKAAKTKKDKPKPSCRCLSRTALVLQKTTCAISSKAVYYSQIKEIWEQIMKYVLLLRGINVGGKNKVMMAELKGQLTQLGYANVIAYINSGNLIFDAEEAVDVKTEVRQMLADQYDFEIRFALISGEAYAKAVEALPTWWAEGGLARRDALFFTDGVTRELAEARIGKMKLHDEIVHYSDIAVFWGKIHEKEYLKTAYHKQLASEDLYKKVTIRNGNTVEKLLALLRG